MMVLSVGLLSFSKSVYQTKKTERKATVIKVFPLSFTFIAIIQNVINFLILKLICRVVEYLFFHVHKQKSLLQSVNMISRRLQFALIDLQLSLHGLIICSKRVVSLQKKYKV